MEEDMVQETGGSEETFKKVMFDKPIPGQSLTNSSDKKMPYERPPEFTNIDKAQTYVFDSMMERGEDVVDLITMGIPVTTIAMSVLMKGFANGKWNPDLLLMLIEPTIYITLFIAEQAGVDYILDADEEMENLPPEARMKATNYLEKTMKEVTKKVEASTDSASVEELLPPSLLSKEGM